MSVVVSRAGIASVPGAERRAILAEALLRLTRIAFAALVVVSPFRARILLDERLAPPLYPEYTNLLLFWSDFLLIAVLTLWALSLALRPRQLWFGPALVRWPVIGLLLAVWASVPFAIDPSLSLYSAARLTLVAPLVLYCANEIESLAQLLPALAVMVLIQAIVAVGQVIGQESLGLGRLGEYNLTPQADSAAIIWTQDQPTLLRGYGLSDHPNILGGILALALLVFATGLRPEQPLRFGVLSAVFALGGVALFLTFSRSAALAMAAGLAVILALLAYRRDWPRLRVWLSVCLGAALIGAVFLAPYAPYLWARANPTEQAPASPEGRSLNEREALAQVSNQIFVDHPVAGVGIGGLPLAMRRDYPDFGFDYQPAHFVLLVAAAETGLFGAFFYAALLVTPWVLVFWRRRQLTPELIGLSGALLALSVIGLFDYYTWSRASGQVWAWVVLGLWVGAYARCVRTPADA